MINKRTKSPKRYKSQEGKYGSVEKTENEELKMGINVEKEHTDTIKKIAKGKIKPKDAPEAIAKDHLKESETYYEDLAQMEEKEKEVENSKLDEPDFEEAFKTIQKKVIVPILMKYGYENVDLPEGVDTNSVVHFKRKMFNKNISNTGEIILNRVDNSSLIAISGNISIKVEEDNVPHDISIHRDIELSQDWDLKGLKNNIEESFVAANELLEKVVEQIYIKQNATTVEQSKLERTGVIIGNWSEVPSAWKNIDTIKKVNYSNTPYNKDLIKLSLPFSGDDELRAVLQGINFDDNGITVTNSHILIHLPYPNSDYYGTYNTFPKKKFLTEDAEKIKNDLFPKDRKYPDINKAIPIADPKKAYKVSLYKLLQYVNVAEKYVNPVTKLAAFSYGDKLIGFNTDYLETIIETCLKLGHETINLFIGDPNSAVVFSPDLDYSIGKSEILLIMPVMLSAGTYYINSSNDQTECGVENQDLQRYLDVCYDFSKDEIVNADGSIVDFKMNYVNDSVLTTNELKILNKYAGNNPTIPILEYVWVKDKEIMSTNLITQFTVKDVNISDGVYKVKDGAVEYDPVMTLTDMDSFPVKKQIDSFDIEFNVSLDVLRHYIKIALDFTSNDDSRPKFTGIFVELKDGKLSMVSTNAHVLFKKDISEYVSIIKSPESFGFILNSDQLWKVISNIEGDEVSVKISLDQKTSVIETPKYKFISSLIDDKYPAYQGVIPVKNIFKITINIKELFNCIRSKEAVDFISKHKKDEVNIYDQKLIDSALSDIYLGYIDFSDRSNPKLEKVKICTVELKYEEVESYSPDSLMLIMPIIAHSEVNPSNFIFRYDLFKEILDNVNCENMVMSYSAPNRAYIVDSSCLEYKKTITSIKTKNRINDQLEQEIKDKVIEQEKIDTEAINKQFNNPDEEIKAGITESEDNKQETLADTSAAIEMLYELAETQKGKKKKETMQAIEMLTELRDSMM